AHRADPRPGQLPSEALVDGDALLADDLEVLPRPSWLHEDLFVGVGLPCDTVGAEFGDRAGPRRRDEHPIIAVPAELGGARPPLTQLRILQGGMTELVTERPRQAVEAVFLPEIQHLGPSPRGADD